MTAPRLPRILLVTSLYPLDDDDRETTWAVHHFVRHWQGRAEVLVIRPCFINPKRNRYWPKRLRSRVEGVRVFHVPTLVSMGVVQFSFSVGLGFLKRLGFVPDLVVSHMRPAHLLAHQLARRFGAKFAMALHGSDLLWPLDQVRRVGRDARVVIARSPSIGAQVVSKVPAYRDRLFVANSGIPAGEILPADAFAVKARDWTGTTRFMTVARLIPLKNFDTVLAALAQVRDLDWRFDIVGDGPERSALERQCRTLGLAERVTFLGYRPRAEVFSLLPQSHVFLMPSAPETFGLAYLEAMAKASLPVCARGWGIDGLIVNNGNGFTVEARNRDELAALLRQVCTASPEQKSEWMSALHRSIGQLTEEAVAGDYLSRLLQEIP